jgi:hypothetical protein
MPLRVLQTACGDSSACGRITIIIIIIIIIIITTIIITYLLTAIGLSPGGSSPTLVQTKIKIQKTTITTKHKKT